jgi:hypothetical protein
MSDLLLKRYYDIIANGVVVGRIMLFTTTPVGLPWVWTMAPGHGEDRPQMHGYEATSPGGVRKELPPEIRLVQPDLAH